MPLSSAHLLAYWQLTSTTWLVLWTVLATLTVLLVVLLRTRWSNARPWRKCAVLSLWVHVLLACIATTVRIVTGAAGEGPDTPIRVAVLPATAVSEEALPRQSAPDWELPSDPPLVAPIAEPLATPPLDETDDGPDAAALEHVIQTAEDTAPRPDQIAPPLEAPSLLERQPPADSQTTAAEPKQPSTDSPSGEPTEAAKVETAALPSTAPESPANESPHPTDTPPVQSPLPATYADRFAKNRAQLVVQRGGSAQTERAVREALAWLATSQSEHGGWDASRFGAGRERMVLGHDRRGAGARADTGVTGLALLAFLGAGHTHRVGPYAHQVADGLEYLRGRQRSDGSLYGDAQLFARMYCHSMATFAVCEAYALTRDQRLESVARAAVEYSLAMQHPTDGGWRYRRGDTGDTSQLGWQLMALKSAQRANLDVPTATWTRVDRFLRHVRRGAAGGLAAYRPEGPASRTMTAEAMFCRQLLADSNGIGMSPAAAREAVESLSRKLPSTARRNFYYWYYATLALYRVQNQSLQAAAAWQQWNQTLIAALLATQQKNGSWGESTVWGGYGGRVYTTALAAMCLEVYYRYSPANGPSEVAQRKDWHPVPR